MNNSITLNKEELTELMKLGLFWDATYGTNPKFYSKFLSETIKNIPEIDTSYFKEALQLSNNNFGNVSADAKKFVNAFDEKIPLPEAFTIFKLFGTFYGSSKERTSFKEIILFLSKKVEDKQIHSMMESYLLKYNNDNSVILTGWFELLEKNPSWINIDNAETIISQNLKDHSINTQTRRFNLKMLCFLNQFLNKKDVISSYIESNQHDAVFLKSADKITGKVKDLSWNQKEISIIKSKKILGTITLDSDSLVQKYGMNRGESEKFISAGLSFICQRFKEHSFSYTSSELLINASDIDEYKYREEQAIDKINKILLLAPLWKTPKDRNDDYIFFNNYYEKTLLNNSLNQELIRNEPNKTLGKKSKI